MSERAGPWRPVCPVDVSRLAHWLASGASGWGQTASPTKPQRIHEPPLELCQPIMEAVLLHFPGCYGHAPMLSKMEPGQSHPMHVDRQRADWVMRIHCPVTTNPGAWLEFEGEGRCRFAVGMAYTFDTTHRHAFGNDGDTPRVHFIFDVLRRDT